MEVKTRDLPGSKKEFLFELEWDKFQVFFDRALKKIRDETELKGFRKGKAPQEMVEKAVGTDTILAEAAELCINKHYPQYVIDKGWQVLEQPQVEVLKLAKGNPFCFRARVYVLPDIELPDYKQIAQTVERQTVEVSDKEIEEALEWLRRSRADFKDLERPAQLGDFVRISYQSEQLKNGQHYDDAFVLGKGGFVQGFEEQLQGMAPGQEKEFSVQFPKEYPGKNLAGKEVRFKVKMKRVQGMKLPSLNDEFAKALGRFDNLSALRNSVKQGLLEEKQMVKKQERRILILERIVEKTKFELPQNLVDLEKAELQKQARSQQGDKQTGLSQDQVKEIENQAKKRVKNFLVVMALGQKEGIQVSEQEVEAAAQGFLKRFKNIEEAEKALDPTQLRRYYRNILYQEKVLQKLEQF